MVQRIDSLTAGQLAELTSHAQQWVDMSRRTAPADRDAFEAAAEACYTHAGLPWHGNVVWVDSPLTLWLAAHTALYLHHEPPPRIRSAAQSLRRAVGERAWDAAEATRQRSRTATRRESGAFGDLLEEGHSAAFQRSAWNLVKGPVRVAINDGLRQVIVGGVYTVHHPVWEVVSDLAMDAGSGLAGPIGERWLTERFRILDGHLSHGMKAEPAFTRFLREVCALELPQTVWDRCRAYEQTMEHAYCWVPHRSFVLACERPLAIHHEESARSLRAAAERPLPLLHCMDGPAFAWRDGWSVYAWHGRVVPPWIIEHPEAITVTAIEHERNVELRRVMLERYGWTRYITGCGARIVDQMPMDHAVPGLRGARLLRKDLPGEPEPIVYLDMVNSTPEPDGSHKHYLERIDPKAYGGEAAVSCHAAMASRWHFRDENGLLRRTFPRWQDYLPGAES